VCGSLKRLQKPLDVSLSFVIFNHEDSWAYAFFVRLYPNRFISFDSNKSPLVAVSTYDMGNKVIRYVMIYRVKEDRLEMVREIPGFNAAADHSVFQ
jgi:hypothetical protein